MIMSTATLTTQYDPKKLRGSKPGDVRGLYGRMPGDLMKLVRRIADAPNYDFAAMELLDAMNMEWRE